MGVGIAEYIGGAGIIVGIYMAGAVGKADCGIIGVMAGMGEPIPDIIWF